MKALFILKVLSHHRKFQNNNVKINRSGAKGRGCHNDWHVVYAIYGILYTIIEHSITIETYSHG